MLTLPLEVHPLLLAMPPATLIKAMLVDEMALPTRTLAGESTNPVRTLPTTATSYNLAVYRSEIHDVRTAADECRGAVAPELDGVDGGALQEVLARRVLITGTLCNENL